MGSQAHRGLSLNPLRLWGAQSFLLKPSPDWMRPLERVIVFAQSLWSLT